MVFLVQASIFIHQLKTAALHARYDQYQQHWHHEHKDQSDPILSQYP